MAAEEKKEKEAEAPAKPKKGLPKVPIIIGAITIVQAVGFFFGFKMLGAGPEVMHGAEHAEPYLEGGDPAVEPATAEIVLFSGFRVPNIKSGRTYIYDFDVSFKAPSHRQEEAQTLVTGRKGEIGDRVARIVRGADPSVLQEPELKTLREQLRQILCEIAKDPELIMEVFIPRFVPIRAD